MARRIVKAEATCGAGIRRGVDSTRGRNTAAAGHEMPSLA